jgi:hypothetical protein
VLLKESDQKYIGEREEIRGSRVDAPGCRLWGIPRAIPRTQAQLRFELYPWREEGVLRTDARRRRPDDGSAELPN